MKLDFYEWEVVSKGGGLGCRACIFIVQFQFVSVYGSFLYCETDAGWVQGDQRGFQVCQVLKMAELKNTDLNTYDG